MWNRAQRRVSALPTDVYRIWDDGGRLLYVGCSVNAFRRLMQHRRYAPWWEESRTATVSQYPDRKTARRVEAVAIRDEDPVYNVTNEVAELFAGNGNLLPDPVDVFTMWRDADRWWIDA